MFGRYILLCVSLQKTNQLKQNIMTFTKTFDTDNDSNTYTSDCGVYELYRARTYKNNGASKCDGDWLVQRNGVILTSFPTLRKAKQVVLMDSMH